MLRRAANVMPSTLTNGAVRMQPESFRSDSLPARTVSQPMRITAKSEFLQVVNEVKSRLGYSLELMAANAECPVSSMGDALAGKDNRNFAGHWLIAQGNEFIDLYNRLIDERRGLTPESRKANLARQLGEMVRLLVENAS